MSQLHLHTSSKIRYNKSVHKKLQKLLSALLAFTILKKYWLLISTLTLTILAIFLRWYPIHGGLFTFEYDMAKDSLIMLEMYQYKDPSLVGPTTSIPGLFYGPAWYYIALIPNILLGFSPFAGILVVWLAMALNIYLFQKYLGTFEAFLYAVSSGVIGAQQNAWTPYMTTLITGPLLLALTKVKSNTSISTKHLSVIALITSLLFHFQVAFAVVATPIVLALLFAKKIKVSFTQIGIGIAVFFSTLVPSLLFELKNNFIQTKSLIAFVENFGTEASVIEPNATGIGRLGEVATEMITTAGQALSPVHPSFWYGLLILLVTLLFLKYHKNRDESLPVLFILVGTFLFYLVLPMKAYYLVALMPVWIYAVGSYFRGIKSIFKPAIMLLFFVLALFHASWQRNTYVALANTTPDLYAPKLEAVETIYALADSQEFSSYHFVPQIYDYTYQFIYLNKIRQGYVSPAEFSYAPSEYAYNTYKHISATPTDSDLVFLIVEKPQYQNVQDEWWNRVGTDLTIEKEIQISGAITVYQARRVTTE